MHRKGLSSQWRAAKIRFYKSVANTAIKLRLEGYKLHEIVESMYETHGITCQRNIYKALEKVDMKEKFTNAMDSDEYTRKKIKAKLSYLIVSNLRTNQGLSYEKIAEICGCDRSTISLYCSRNNIVKGKPQKTIFPNSMSGNKNNLKSSIYESF